METPVLREDRLRLLDRQLIGLAVARQIFRRHGAGDRLRIIVLDEGQRLQHRPRDLFDLLGMLGDEVALRIEHRRGIDAAINRLRTALAPRVDQDPADLAGFQHGRRGIVIDQQVDIALFKRRHRRGAGADADQRDIVGGDAVALQIIADEEIGRRPRRGDADLGPPDGFRAGRIELAVLARREDEARIARQHDEGDDILVLRLHLDGVVVKTHRDVRRPGDQRLQHLRSALREILGPDLDAGFLEIAFRIRDEEGQVRHVVRGDAHADHRLVAGAGTARERQAERADSPEKMTHSPKAPLRFPRAAPRFS